MKVVDFYAINVIHNLYHEYGENQIKMGYVVQMLMITT